MFGTKQEPKLIDAAIAQLDTHVLYFINSMVNAKEVDLSAIREALPQYFGVDGRNLVAQRIAHLRNVKEAQGSQYNSSAGRETR
jgi:hypothetical protein